MRHLENKILKEESIGFIFQTYNNSKLDVLSDMSILFMFARKGWSNAPWFTKERK